jgi:hypothetical protein
MELYIVLYIQKVLRLCTCLIFILSLDFDITRWEANTQQGIALKRKPYNRTQEHWIT